MTPATAKDISLWLDSGARVFAPNREVLAVHSNGEVELVGGGRLDPAGMTATTKDYEHIFLEKC